MGIFFRRRTPKRHARSIQKYDSNKTLPETSSQKLAPALSGPRPKFQHIEILFNVVSLPLVLVPQCPFRSIHHRNRPRLLQKRTLVLQRMQVALEPELVSGRVEDEFLPTERG
jgi:hypothetical protein